MNRLKEIRNRKGITREELADIVGTTPTTIYRKENGLRDITSKDAEKYAKALGCNPSDFFNGSHESTEAPTVPLVGYVGAGASIYPFDDHAKGQGLDRVECPSNMNPTKTVAVEVRGDSMEPLIHDRFLLFYEERFHGVAIEFLNKTCIVWLDDGRGLVKNIRKGSKAGHYTLESLNPSEKPIVDALVVYSAFVKNFVQR